MRKRTNLKVEKLGGSFEALKNPTFASTAPYPNASAYVSHKADEQGFVSLDPQKNFRNWAGDRDYWSMKDGMIIGKHDGSLKRNTYLSWRGSTIQNFELQLKVKVSPNGNSGVQYRSQSRPDLDLYAVGGYQCDIAPHNSEHHGQLLEEKGRRTLAKAGEKVVLLDENQMKPIGTFPLHKVKQEQWHEVRLVVKGDHHQHWLNGHLVVDARDSTKVRSQEGILALELCADQKMSVQFKDIRIKHFDDH